jgi:hypothetical protein
MEELITRIQEYIRELGAFDIENVDTRKKVSHEGYSITYFDLDVVKVNYPNEPEYVSYKDLHQDVLLEILYIAMEYKHKWEQYDK